MSGKVFVLPGDVRPVDIFNYNMYFKHKICSVDYMFEFMDIVYVLSKTNLRDLDAGTAIGNLLHGRFLAIDRALQIDLRVHEE